MNTVFIHFLGGRFALAGRFLGMAIRILIRGSARTKLAGGSRMMVHQSDRPTETWPIRQLMLSASNLEQSISASVQIVPS